MDMKTYKEKALRTASPAFFTQTVNHDAFVKDTLAKLLEVNKTVDAAKKALYYNKDGSALLGKPDAANEAGWAKVDNDLLHAGLGLVSEGVEFLEKVLAPKKATKAELVSELGDNLWYANIATRALDTDLGEVADANIVKLAHRYPDAFSLDLANAKSVKAEDALIAEMLDRKEELGWLLEVKAEGTVDPRPRWFSAKKGGDSLTFDASKALRFARQIDAEDFRDIFQPGLDAVATEHAWS